MVHPYFDIPGTSFVSSVFECVGSAVELTVSPLINQYNVLWLHICRCWLSELTN
jgi:hypothetical protein